MMKGNTIILYIEHCTRHSALGLYAELQQRAALFFRRIAGSRMQRNFLTRRASLELLKRDTNAHILLVDKFLENTDGLTGTGDKYLHKQTKK